jgi:hypothetical protein
VRGGMPALGRPPRRGVPRPTRADRGRSRDPAGTGDDDG